MISMALPAATPQLAASGAPALQRAKISEFAALVQRPAAPPPAQTSLVQAEAGPGDKADGVDAALEDFDVTTADGLTGLLYHTIAVLQASGDDVKPKDVLAAFAAALGEKPAANLGELDAVSQISDPALVTALQGRIAQAFPVATTISQLSIACVGVPLVALEVAVEPAAAKPAGLAPLAVSHGGPRLDAAAANKVQLTAVDRRLTDKVAVSTKNFAPDMSVGAAEAVAANLTGAMQDGLPRDVPAAVLPQIQLPQDMQRIAPTPMAAPHHAPSPDDQLRHHVGQQIRAADLGDLKFRFSLSPYGMGDIEIEVVRTETGRMQITMTAETASVLQILRHDKDQLLDALQSRGITLETADLDFQTFDDRGRQNQQQPQSPMLTNLVPEQEADASPVPAVRVTGGSGLLDILT
jgi:flagellar hook-length control protein FliK